LLLGIITIILIIIIIFIIIISILLADVATDTLAVERSKLESESEKGNLQSLAYTYRAVGMILGAVAGNHTIFCNLTHYSESNNR